MTTAFTRTWTQNWDGSIFDIAHLSQNLYKPVNIAHHLGMICRYGGATDFFYSVAEHSVILADYAMRTYKSPLIALDCLVHDSSEAKIWDVKRPQKPFFPDAVKHEKDVDLSIRQQWNPIYGVPLSILPETKELDARITLDEKEQALLECEQEWTFPEGLKPLGVRIVGLQPAAAKRAWLERWNMYTAGVAFMRNRNCHDQEVHRTGNSVSGPRGVPDHKDG